ncbi:hypothetical protein BDV95DRAFT_598295 [Massariosphaeria phaeospora]|uniref:Uncharacterized protein n=1 Tax=Massariosphaeria phaeospora TaxID=100035 RepID=A0A7C8I7I6_9PLEO|nr:hypothetical protein BDV95DRAFT_598295 [Massariosphaeria phaeospora]
MAPCTLLHTSALFFLLGIASATPSPHFSALPSHYSHTLNYAHAITPNAYSSHPYPTPIPIPIPPPNYPLSNCSCHLHPHPHAPSRPSTTSTSTIRLPSVHIAPSEHQNGTLYHSPTLSCETGASTSTGSVAVTVVTDGLSVVSRTTDGASMTTTTSLAGQQTQTPSTTTGRSEPLFTGTAVAARGGGVSGPVWVWGVGVLVGGVVGWS